MHRHAATSTRWRALGQALLGLVLIRAQPCDAQEPLNPGREVLVESDASSVRTYGITLDAGDLATVVVRVDAGAVRASIISPAGDTLRTADLAASAERRLLVPASEAGLHRLDLAPTPGAAFRGRVTLAAVATTEQRMSAVVREPVTSPRIQALSARAEQGDATAATSFLEDVRRVGAPLVEPDPGDPDYRLLTFLWQGHRATRSVLVQWSPYSNARPQEYLMTELGRSGLWFKTLRVHKASRFAYRLAPDFHAASPLATSQADPLNPRRRLLPGQGGGRLDGESLVELPDAQAQSWGAAQAETTKGTRESRVVASRILERRVDVDVYLPPGYSRTAGSHALLIALGREEYQDDGPIPLPSMLDSLITDRRVKPMVAVAVEPGQGAQNNPSARIGCNEAFAGFLHDELLPWLRTEYRVTGTPGDIYITGASLGGLTAACVALMRPAVAGNVIAQSGSFWWSPGRCMAERTTGTCTNWVAEQYAAKPRVPVRFWLEAGHYEVDMLGRGGLILEPTRHLRGVLEAKGYDVLYREFHGGHDYLSWPVNLADALIRMAGHGSTGIPPQP